MSFPVKLHPDCCHLFDYVSILAWLANWIQMPQNKERSLLVCHIPLEGQKGIKLVAGWKTSSLNLNSLSFHWAFCIPQGDSSWVLKNNKTGHYEVLSHLFIDSSLIPKVKWHFQISDMMKILCCLCSSNSIWLDCTDCSPPTLMEEHPSTS